MENQEFSEQDVINYFSEGYSIQEISKIFNKSIYWVSDKIATFICNRKDENE